MKKIESTTYTPPQKKKTHKGDNVVGWVPWKSDFLASNLVSDHLTDHIVTVIPGQDNLWRSVLPSINENSAGEYLVSLLLWLLIQWKL